MPSTMRRSAARAILISCDKRTLLEEKMPDENINKAKDAAGDMLEDAKEVAENLWEKAKDLGEQAKDRFDKAMNTDGKTKDGSDDTRDMVEKIKDAVTGDNVDDKTGKEID
jgi:vacuolar-type H+-ATPase subunit H